MEEEKKEVVEEASVEEVKAEQAPAEEINSEANLKNVLISFILAVAGFVVSASAIVTMILGIVALNFLKKVPGQVTKAPHKVFQKIAKPVAIVDIVVGIVVTVAYIIWAIVAIVIAVGAAAAATAGA